MKLYFLVPFMMVLPAIMISCNGQAGNKQATTISNTIVGGGCDGCELMYVGLPGEIDAIDTSEGWNENGTRLKVTGTVYKKDGKTPAPGVVIYYWQTDNSGYYTATPGMDQQAKVHGHIRGWVKTDEQGRYTIYTIRPAPYSNDVLPAHIHFSIKEPGIANEYYTDDLTFEDDKLLAAYYKNNPPANRGGSGIVRVVHEGVLQVANHNIVLGVNIPGYPER